MTLPEDEADGYPIPAAGAGRGQPVDLAHLARQTFGDRDILNEVLKLFVDQANAVAERIASAPRAERIQLAHALRGSSGGIGAFDVAETAAALERDPDNGEHLRRLGERISDARRFIASIRR